MAAALVTGISVLVVVVCCSLHIKKHSDPPSVLRIRSDKHGMISVQHDVFLHYISSVAYRVPQL